MVLVGKPEGKRTPGRRRHRQEDNIKMGKVKVNVLLFLYLTNEGVCGSGFIDPHFLDFGTIWW
jgi:hypothetical protein